MSVLTCPTPWVEKFAARQPSVGRAFVFKDRLAYADPGGLRLGVDENAMSASFVVTTERPDRQGDVVRSQGVRLDSYSNNPIWFFNHQVWPLPIGKARGPDGRLAVVVEDARILATCYFSQKSAEAAQVFALVVEDILRATSIGFSPLAEPMPRSRSEPNPESTQVGYYFDNWDLLEVSVVGVPAQPQATLLRSHLSKGIIAGSPISPMLRKSLEPFSEPTPVWANGASFAGKALDAQGGEVPPPQLLAAAKANDFVTFPEKVPGATCANCEHDSDGVCQFDGNGDPAKSLKGLPVTDRNCCSSWDAPGTLRAFERAKCVRGLVQAFIQQPDAIKIIRHEGNEWVLYSHDGKVLGRHDSKEDAEAQEAAIEAHKHGGKAMANGRTIGPRTKCNPTCGCNTGTNEATTMSAKDMNEGSGTAGGYTTPEKEPEKKGEDSPPVEGVDSDRPAAEVKDDIAAVGSAWDEHAEENGHDYHHLFYHPKTKSVHHTHAKDMEAEHVSTVKDDLSAIDGVKDVTQAAEEHPGMGEGYELVHPKSMRWNHKGFHHRRNKRAIAQVGKDFASPDVEEMSLSYHPAKAHVHAHVKGMDDGDANEMVDSLKGIDGVAGVTRGEEPPTEGDYEKVFHHKGDGVSKPEVEETGEETPPGEEGPVDEPEEKAALARVLKLVPARHHATVKALGKKSAFAAAVRLIPKAVKDALEDCVSAKVPKLRDEGYPEDQALAISYSVCGEEKRFAGTIAKAMKAANALNPDEIENKADVPDPLDPAGVAGREQPFGDADLPPGAEDAMKLIELCETAIPRQEPEVRTIFEDVLEMVNEWATERYPSLDFGGVDVEHSKEPDHEADEEQATREAMDRYQQLRGKPAQQKAALRRVMLLAKRLSKADAGVIGEARDHLKDLSDKEPGSPFSRTEKSACKAHHKALDDLHEKMTAVGSPPNDGSGDGDADDVPPPEEKGAKSVLGGNGVKDMVAPLLQQIGRLTGRN